MQADFTQDSIAVAVDRWPSPAKLPTMYSALLNRKNLSWPVLISCLTDARVGDGIKPLKPPRGSTSWPVAMM